MDKSWIKLPCSSPVYLAGLDTFLDFAFSHASINGKINGLHLPRTSQVGNQVHQDDPVNEAIRDGFGVQDDNFTPGSWSKPVFFRMMQLENFSASWMRAIVLCIKVVEILKVIFSIKLYHIKCMCGITDKAMSMFPGITLRCFPDADIPSSFYEAKKIIND
ncbi:hypothetical protein K1719_030896 [Acacia pycnantha]|nr:hypothetical protein K1719_030896 [Acacia pycnantha]